MGGLDDAGKTTILYKFKMDETVTTISTVGFNETVEFKNVNFTVWDINGKDRIRCHWKHYYQVRSRAVSPATSKQEAGLVPEESSIRSWRRYCTRRSCSRPPCSSSRTNRTSRTLWGQPRFPRNLACRRSGTGLGTCRALVLYLVTASWRASIGSLVHSPSSTAEAPLTKAGQGCQGGRRSCLCKLSRASAELCTTFALSSCSLVVSSFFTFIRWTVCPHSATLLWRNRARVETRCKGACV